MWYGEHGGSWCTAMVTIPAMVLLPQVDAAARAALSARLTHHRHILEVPRTSSHDYFTRRAAHAALSASAVAGFGYALRGILGSPALRIRLTDGGVMGASQAGTSLSMDMFNRHTEITPIVGELPGGVGTTTEWNAPDLRPQLHAHVSSMYAHVGQGAEGICMSKSLQTHFCNRND